MEWNFWAARVILWFPSTVGTFSGNFKGCISSKYCQPGNFSTTTKLNQSVQALSTCCNTDYCNKAIHSSKYIHLFGTSENSCFSINQCSQVLCTSKRKIKELHFRALQHGGQNLPSSTMSGAKVSTDQWPLNYASNICMHCTHIPYTWILATLWETENSEPRTQLWSSFMMYIS